MICTLFSCTYHECLQPCPTLIVYQYLLTRVTNHLCLVVSVPPVGASDSKFRMASQIRFCSSALYVEFDQNTRVGHPMTRHFLLSWAGTPVLPHSVPHCLTAVVRTAARRQLTAEPGTARTRRPALILSCNPLYSVQHSFVGGLGQDKTVYILSKKTPVKKNFCELFYFRVYTYYIPPYE